MLVAAPMPNDKWVVTLPNMAFILSPPIGVVKVVLWVNYRYGCVHQKKLPMYFRAKLVMWVL